MFKSAIVLAGGFSKRFGQDKGLVSLANKPLVKHVLDRISNVVDEKIVVVSSEAQAQKYLKVLGPRAEVLIDNAEVQSPLAGAMTGFGQVNGTYSLLLACDMPFVSKDIVRLLLELCPGKEAVVPRWPNCNVEPLQAAYCTKPALEAAADALKSGNLNVQAMVSRLKGVRYVSTLVLEQLDPGLETFFNVNTPLDIKKAEVKLKRP